MQKVLSDGRSEGKEKIRKMFLDSNEIKSVDFITSEFRNLILLELSTYTLMKVTIPSKI